MEPVLCPVILGRDAELAVPRAALTDAEAGRGSLIVLTADAGIGIANSNGNGNGKVRHLRELINTALARQHSTGQQHSATCYPTQDPPPQPTAPRTPRTSA